MRSHLIKIFESNTIEHFPQDPSHSTFQEVFPLAIVRRREYDAGRMRAMRKNKMNKDKLKEIDKTYNISNIKVDNNQQDILIQSKEATENYVTEEVKFSQNNKRKNCDVNNYPKPFKKYQHEINVEGKVIIEKWSQCDLDNQCTEWRKYYTDNKEKITAKRRKRYATKLKKRRQNKLNVSHDQKLSCNKQYSQETVVKSNVAIKNSVA